MKMSKKSASQYSASVLRMMVLEVILSWIAGIGLLAAAKCYSAGKSGSQLLLVLSFCTNLVYCGIFLLPMIQILYYSITKRLKNLFLAFWRYRYGYLVLLEANFLLFLAMEILWLDKCPPTTEIEYKLFVMLLYLVKTTRITLIAFPALIIGLDILNFIFGLFNRPLISEKHLREFWKKENGAESVLEPLETLEEEDRNIQFLPVKPFKVDTGKSILGTIILFLVFVAVYWAILRPTEMIAGLQLTNGWDIFAVFVAIQLSILIPHWIEAAFYQKKLYKVQKYCTEEGDRR